MLEFGNWLLDMIYDGFCEPFKISIENNMFCVSDYNNSFCGRGVTLKEACGKFVDAIRESDEKLWLSEARESIKDFINFFEGLTTDDLLRIESEFECFDDAVVDFIEKRYMEQQGVTQSG